MTILPGFLHVDVKRPSLDAFLYKALQSHKIHLLALLGPFTGPNDRFPSLWYTSNSKIRTLLPLPPVKREEARTLSNDIFSNKTKQFETVENDLMKDCYVLEKCICTCKRRSVEREVASSTPRRTKTQDLISTEKKVLLLKWRLLLEFLGRKTVGPISQLFRLSGSCGT